MQPNIIFGAYMPTPTPAHAVKLTVSLPVNDNDEMGTSYQVTAPPISDGPSGGTSGTMSYSAPSGVSDRSSITLTAVGATDFGSLGPELLFASDAKNTTAGGAYDLTDFDGVGTVTSHSGTLLVDAVPDLPQGKGFRICTIDGNPSTTGLIQVASTEETPAFYEHVVYYSPQSLQENAIGHQASNWQIKTIWHRFTSSNSSDEYKFHNSFGGFYGETDPLDGVGYYKKSSMVSSGLAGTSHYPFSDAVNTCTDPKTRYIRSDIMSQQTMTKIDVADGFIDTYLRNKGTELVSHTTFNGQTMIPSPPTPHVGPTRCYIPGYVRGRPSDLSTQVYYADIFIQYGAGALARVEITDNEDYEAGNLVPCKIDSWAAGEITVTSRAGVFYGESMSGNWIHVHDHLNNHISKVQIT